METEVADEGNVEAVGTAAEYDQATLSDAPDPEPRAGSELSIDEVDRLLDEVEAALSRIDDGTYGRCAVCGGTIDDTLLAGSPTARICEACTPPIGD